MQLRAHFTENGDLELTAATYSTSEFGALHDVLGKAGLFRIQNPLRRDRMKRMVQEYHISRRQIKRLENILGGSFDKQGQFISKRTQGGRNYACREVTTGTPGGCEDIIASDDSTALVKCALIAGRNDWFGGVATAGVCSGRGI
jgi:hypothetical protein